MALNPPKRLRVASAPAGPPIETGTPRRAFDGVTCPGWLPHGKARAVYGPKFVKEEHVCRHAVLIADQHYCLPCLNLHRACKKALCTKLIGRRVTFTTIPNRPLALRMLVEVDDWLHATGESTATQVQKRMSISLACCNAACRHMPDVENTATNIH